MSIELKLNFCHSNCDDCILMVNALNSDKTIRPQGIQSNCYFIHYWICQTLSPPNISSLLFLLGKSFPSVPPLQSFNVISLVSSACLCSSIIEWFVTERDVQIVEKNELWKLMKIKSMNYDYWIVAKRTWFSFLYLWNL